MPRFVKEDPSDDGDDPSTPVVRPSLGPITPSLSSPLGDELGGRLFDEIRRRPARSVLIAVGTGFLAGGGLGAGMTARLLGAGARLALRLAIVPLFVDALERAVSAPRSSFFQPSTTNHVH